MNSLSTILPILNFFSLSIRQQHFHVFMPFGHDGLHHLNDREWQLLLLPALMSEQLFQCPQVEYWPINSDGKVYFTFSVRWCIHFLRWIKVKVIKRIFISINLQKWILFWCKKGAIGCVWYIFWIIIVRESPDKDTHISQDELRYIQENLGPKQSHHIKHPWKDIFTSKAVYAISASHFAENWGFYTMLTQLPSFLKGNKHLIWITEILIFPFSL